MSQPNRAVIITRAVALLQGGTPLRALPKRLMSEFGISAKLAAELTITAQQRLRKEARSPEQGEQDEITRE